jgi:hypothetical protein
VLSWIGRAGNAEIGCIPASILRKQWVRVGLLVVVVVTLGGAFVVLAPSPGFRLPGEG